MHGGYPSAGVGTSGGGSVFEGGLGSAFGCRREIGTLASSMQ
jgi:hypothetical protein